MTTSDPTRPMTGDEMVALTKRHTLFEWSAQAAVDPIPVARAKGIYFWTPEGKRFIDFNSQLMCVNIGHGDERVIEAIQRPGGRAGLRQPVHGDRAARASRREARRDHAGRHRRVLLHQRRRRGERERRSTSRALFTGRHKILARYRSYHGGTAGSHHADRRSAALGRRARHARRRPRARPVPRHRSAAGTPPSRRWPRSRRSSSWKGRRPSPASSSSRSPAPTASSCRPTATCRACARCAPSTAS